MKIFIYKLLISLLAFYILFELTIGPRIDYFKNFIDTFKDNDQRIIIKEKLKNELKKAIKKENYFTEEEKYLISNFIIKLKKELSIDKKE